MLSPRRVIQDNRQAALLGTLLIAAAIVSGRASTRHSLTVSAVSWTCIWAYARFRGAPKTSSAQESQGRTLSWVSGVLLALSSVCERAVERGHICWAKVRRARVKSIYNERRLKCHITKRLSSHSSSASSSRPMYLARRITTRAPILDLPKNTRLETQGYCSSLPYRHSSH